MPAEPLGGKLPYDFLLGETDPKPVTMELDLCWISVAGKDPLTYFDKHPGRFPLVHVKDWIKDPNATDTYKGATGSSVKIGGRLAYVGPGTIDLKPIFTHSTITVIPHFFLHTQN